MILIILHPGPWDTRKLAARGPHYVTLGLPIQKPSKCSENDNHLYSSNTEKHQKPETTILARWLAAGLICQKHVARPIG